MTERITNIVIAGGGTAGWIAAAMFARFLERGYRIRLVESEAIGTIGVGEATIPQINLLNSVLGIDEADFVSATRASYKLGIEFVGWKEPGHTYMHNFGVVGRGSGLTPFPLLWLRMHAAGRAQEFGRYSLNEVAARSGKMAKGTPKGSSLPELVYAFHFDASLYAAFLRKYAEERGVERIEGRIHDVERHSDSGDIEALVLDGERRVDGQLFIDCTGFRGLLISEVLGSRYLNWSDYLPCDRALAVPSERNPAFRPHTQAIAQKAGWQWRIPLQHRTGNGLVYCSTFMSDEEASSTLLGSLDGKPLDEPRPLRFTTGRREHFWVGNCVAVGLAAGFLEPLESTSIHLIQAAVTRLLTFCLPRGPIAPPVRDNFNRLSSIEWERIRDFLVLHYTANGRIGEPFWDHCRAIQLPDKLAAKIEMFKASGRVLREDGELFTEEAFTQVMIGQGIVPGSWHPLADIADDDELSAYLDTIASAYAARAAQLPSHAEFVDHMVARSPSVRAKEQLVS